MYQHCINEIIIINIISLPWNFSWLKDMIKKYIKKLF